MLANTHMPPMRSVTPTDLGALVKETRLSAGMTQAELGERIGASRYWVAEFERGNPGAELGLTLKALRALKLVLTIESRQAVLRREQHGGTGAVHTHLLDQPVIDLSSIIARSTAPDVRERGSDPFQVHGWKEGPRPAEAPTLEEKKPRARKKRNRR
jgi:transcriptional regulator with XRE-family HTH domain